MGREKSETAVINDRPTRTTASARRRSIPSSYVHIDSDHHLESTRRRDSKSGSTLLPLSSFQRL
jgi:hypothetical protein